MKSFIKGILTIWIAILLIVFGVVSSMKSVIIDATDMMMKDELKTNIIAAIENLANKDIPENVIQKVENEIDNNPIIKKLLSRYYDVIMDVLSSKETNVQLDVAKELEALIDMGEEVLGNYGFTLTDQEKQEILSAVSSSEINDLINDSINELKIDLSSDEQMIIDGYIFLTSMTFKVILIVLIAIALLLIALLNKNFYSWLSNFGIAAIITGILMGILLPMLVTEILASLETDSSIPISTASYSTYGYTLIILGIVSIAVKIVISNIQKKKMNDKIEVSESLEG